jgi:hypothetical protein
MFFRSWPLGAVVLLALTGCDNRPKLEFDEVEGKVTLNGKPLRGVLVRFYQISEKREQLPYATGLTDATGFFTLTHHKDQPGALVGTNRVVVNWPSRDMRVALAGDEAVVPPPSAPIPLRYTVLEDNPLNVEVKAGGLQTIDLSLEE